MSVEYDDSERIVTAIREAGEQEEALYLSGTGSKQFLCQNSGGRLLSLTEHRGILDYQPEELVLTARAGTPLDEIEKLLVRHDQFLPFEPPLLSVLDLPLLVHRAFYRCLDHMK